MCKSCVDAVRHFWPEMPDDEIGNWLYGATGFPFWTPEQLWRECATLKRKIGANYAAAYGIADHELDVAMDGRGGARYWINRARHKARRDRRRKVTE